MRRALAMIVLSVYSVDGRWLTNAPVQGDFELVFFPALSLWLVLLMG